MKVIAKKTTKKFFINLERIIGMIMMGAAFILIPVAVFSVDREFLTNGYIWAAVAIGMLFFGGVGFFGFVKPYMLFRKLPEVQAETDGKHLYIYGKKEAKIPLSALEDAYIDAVIPYTMTLEYLLHLLSDRYGRVIINVPGYGKYKLHFIAEAREAAQELAALTEGK